MKEKNSRFGGKQLLVLLAALALVGLLVFAVVSWSNRNEKTAQARADSEEDLATTEALPDSPEDLPVFDTLPDTQEGL